MDNFSLLSIRSKYLIIEIVAYSSRRKLVKHFLAHSSPQTRKFLIANHKLIQRISNKHELTIIEHRWQVLEYIIRNETQEIDMRLKGRALAEYIQFQMQSDIRLPVEVLTIDSIEDVEMALEGIKISEGLQKIQPRKLILNDDQYKYDYNSMPKSIVTLGISQRKPFFSSYASIEYPIRPVQKLRLIFGNNESVPSAQYYLWRIQPMKKLSIDLCFFQFHIAEKALKDVNQLIYFDIDHVEIQVWALTYELYQEFKQLTKFKVSKKLTCKVLDKSIDSNISHMKEVIGCKEIIIGDTTRIRPESIKDAKELMQFMCLPFAVKQISLQGLDSTNFQFVDSLESTPENFDEFTTKLIIDVQEIQSHRFSMLMSWLLVNCTNLKQLSLNMSIRPSFKFAPLQIEKTRLKSIYVSQWEYSMTSVNELIEKSKDTLESLEMKGCKKVSLTGLLNSKVLKSIKIMDQQVQSVFAKQNEEIMITFTNLAQRAAMKLL
ncbi:hypothetical protein FGO68_gene11539 [Halteria grandinella]|uniref:Uncharacterized protein n=1 Tax=Halteria grandinella TaxID=5974 RepID=A0A8J8NVH2_HALGN|nr:hypothetical protein FGO68_gene11539 [Halteria grandinella]